MAQIHAVSFPRHGRMRLQQRQGYGFAAADTIIELGISEMGPALLHHALAFAPFNNEFCLVALQGLLPGQNLMLQPDGSWVPSYLPKAYESYPFSLRRVESGDTVLCVDEDSGLLTESGSGELLFDEQGQPSATLRSIFERLGKLRQDQAHARRAVALLKTHELLEPWPLKFDHDGQDKEIAGIWRVNEARLGQVDGSLLVELRNHGALPLAYAQLISTQNIHKLGPLLALRMQQAQQAAAKAQQQPPGNIFERNDLISFDNL
jgi:hypothetical protein